MRIDHGGHPLPPGQVRATQVHDLLGAGLSPASSARRLNLPEETLDDAAAIGSTPAEAVTVDIAWKDAADAAIAKVESRHGELSDFAKQKVYEDFASRAAGGEGSGPVGRPPWKGWVIENATTPVEDADPADEVTELSVGDGTDDDGLDGADDASGSTPDGGDVSSGELAETDYGTEYVEGDGGDDGAIVQDEDDTDDTESMSADGGVSANDATQAAEAGSNQAVIDDLAQTTPAVDADSDGIPDDEDPEVAVAA